MRIVTSFYSPPCLSAPCPPSSISGSLDCDSQVAVVTWDQQEALGVTYHVNATGGEGTVSTCSTTNSSCSLTGLQCGQEYNVTVIASAHGCASAPSAPYALTQGQRSLM